MGLAEEGLGIEVARGRQRSHYYAVSWSSLQSRGSQTPVSIRPSLGDPGKVWLPDSAPRGSK